jgi:hypothetical protein
LGRSHLSLTPCGCTNGKAREIITKVWNQKIEGSLSFIWETKLKATKATLKEWAKTDYKEPISERKEFQQQLADLQDTMECTEVSQQVHMEEKRLYGKLHQTFRKEEEYCRLRSQSLWIEAGDKNTSFFHKQCKSGNKEIMYVKSKRRMERKP